MKYSHFIHKFRKLIIWAKKNLEILIFSILNFLKSLAYHLETQIAIFGTYSLGCSIFLKKLEKSKSQVLFFATNGSSYGTLQYFFLG